MNAFLGMALVLAALGSLFLLARHGRARGWMTAEYSRKFVHVGMGCIALTFPWLFTQTRPVLVLAAIAAGALLAVRAIPFARARFGCVLLEVKRRSYGEFAFVAGVAAAFFLAHGDPMSYVIPVAVLTFADTLAAVVGTRFGTHRFATLDGTKSLEGSLAFLATAVACVAIPLAVAGRAQAAPIACVSALALTLVEASAWAGLDNVAIPLLGGILVRALCGGPSGGAF
jgi:phytol kinase